MKNNSKYKVVYTLLGGLVILLSQCFPPVERNYDKVSYDLQDPTVQKILDFQDRRMADSIVPYFAAENPAYRLLAFKAFASFADSQYVRHISVGLNDEIEEIRQAAAFALGQQRHHSAESYLIGAFIAVDSPGAFQATNELILEALGKCGTDSTFAYLCETQLYDMDDTALVRGLMKAYYQFGLRGKICSNAAANLITVLHDPRYDFGSRLLAGHCLQRFKNIDVSEHYETLKQLSISEKDPLIRMCIISAFARCKNPGVVMHLEEMYSRGLDPRVQSNLVRSLVNQPGPEAVKLALRACQNPSLHISIPAANYLIEKGDPKIEENIRDLLDLNLAWQVKSLLFEAALLHTPKYKKLTLEYILYKLQSHIQQAKNPYEKAAYIKALGQQTAYLNYLINLYRDDMPAVVKTSLAESIGKIAIGDDFNRTYKNPKNPIYAKLNHYYNMQCNSGDAGVLAVMASTFQKTNPIINAYFKPDSALAAARDRLTLPKHIETYNELSACIAKLKQQQYHRQLPDYNHPIDWSETSKLADSIYIRINTDKGSLRLILLTKVAPGTVLNFIQLIKQGFFTDKVFHRVVPNFVVQSGCPRGDGYGSLDYTVRTEIGALSFLDEGCIGMASAGPDTECSQFFITLSPTPHLDGKYTAFGKLIDGRDVLINIQPGDKIHSIITE